tara:strand:+ start:363 stop:671 length:309 start_codon:yes stop_codon:yes gene_type:complete
MYIIAFIGTLIQSISDIILKEYVTNKKAIYLIIGLIGYILIGYTFMRLLKFHNLGTANIVWHVMHFMILCLVGIFYYNEKYTLKEIIGIILGLMSFYLLGGH